MGGGGGGGAGAPGRAGGGPAPPPDRVDGERHTVTLITGDRVVVAGHALLSVTPGRDRDGITFHRFLRDGRLHVIPRDVARPLADGKLDLRLFDVTGLVDAGYDDARRDTVPLIITGDQPRTGGVQVTRALPTIGSVAARTAKSEAGTAFQGLVNDPGVRKIWLDGIRKPSLDRSVAQIGAPTAWQAGYTGKGVKVAVLDSGVDQTHPDLVGREVVERNFTEDPDNSDLVGHGTHVAATVASAGEKYRGVAPDAQILDGKVCSLNCAESWIVDGMQWAADQGADVINMSLGGTDTPDVDPLEQAIETLSARTGTLFVVAAGNSGRPETLSSPASADAALAVGAVERDDAIADFSSRGPRVGDGAPRPDITAPGVDIVAAKSGTGRIGTPVGDKHVAVSGTSMATPHVAGAAALIAQQHPDWNGAQIKAALMASAKHNPALTAFDQGTGRVDLTKAITTTVTADPPSLALGLQQWPHDDDVATSKEFALRNTGTQPVTLDLAIDAKGPGGAPVPAGVFTVSPATVTVPAGGEAKATVTADTKAATVDGAYSGTVVASGGGVELRVPVGVNREVESYDVTFEFIDAEGRPAVDYFAFVIGLDNDKVLFPSGDGGKATARLPVGEYLVVNEVLTDGTKAAVLPQPSLRVNRDTTSVVADARRAKPVSITFPDPRAEAPLGDLLLTRSRDGRLVAAIGGVYAGGFGNVSIGHLGPELPAEDFSVLVNTHATGTPVGATPVTYRFAWVERGRAPTGFVRAPTKRELAEVRSEFAAGPAGKEHRFAGFPVLPGGLGGLGVEAAVTAPGRSLDYATTAPGVEWAWSLAQFGSGGIEAQLDSPLRTHQPGRTYHQRFNRPVFGPAMPAAPFPYLARSGDLVDFSLPLFGDRDGNSGRSVTSSARTTLLRNGTVVGETGEPAAGRFLVPPGAADFRVEAEGVRAPGVSEFSTAVSGAWTFRSDTVTGDRFAPLPLTVVRFTPALDANGVAPAGRVLRVPLVVEQQPGAANGRVDRVAVEVSFDDGKSWSSAAVVGRTAFVRNPATAGDASLRVKGSDRNGNTFEQTVIRAYRIG
ncbi:S8 family serine peptidase [Saccharothrix luteola]|uniref:S8 family serine peptidase n=1 Tax=Saccharothrix luteola TaxID=2893018 RepID=UPI001E47BCB4|nr:S8 family serine peptidase [Saccharothrix luteola]MCC8249666.1 S8 family serine peptidase [Saccharothrix luteola]